MKAEHISIASTLEDVPNIGPVIAARLRDIGVHNPTELRELDALQTYNKLCQVTRSNVDVTWLDRLLSAVSFATGSAPAPWQDFSEQRRQLLQLREHAATDPDS